MKLHLFFSLCTYDVNQSLISQIQAGNIWKMNLVTTVIADILEP